MIEKLAHMNFIGAHKLFHKFISKSFTHRFVDTERKSRNCEPVYYAKFLMKNYKLWHNL